jgi:hypothetical protein
MPSFREGIAMMTREEYMERLQGGGHFAPGWDAVTEACRKVYGDQKESHYVTELAKRAISGGDEFLDGYNIYVSAAGYRHIVTFGMSSLYGNPKSYGGEFSNWGYEMTMKLVAKSNEDCFWALDMLGNLARYTYRQKRWFEPLQFVSGGGEPIKIGSGSMLKGLVSVSDTEFEGMDTVHGRLDFIQFVGITQRELDWANGNPDNAKLLVERMRADNPMLVTDLARTKEYI